MESLTVVEPTVIADGADDGEKLQASAFEFPAATTTEIPAFVNREIASFTEDDLPPPILKFKTAFDFKLVLLGLKIQSKAAITPE